MDARRLKRLTKLVQVQRQIQALHETRHANHLANSVAAEREAHDLIEQFDSGTLSSTLFPDLYHNRISNAFARRDHEHDLAQGEVGHIDEAMLRRHVDDLDAPAYYLSGPAGMVKAMRTLLVDADVNEDHIRTEEFSGY